MVEHDKTVGEVLKKIKDLGIEDNTIVVYTTDNGPMLATWPDSGMTPFRGEKNRLGRGLPRPCNDPLAGPYPAGYGDQRYLWQ